MLDFAAHASHLCRPLDKANRGPPCLISRWRTLLVGRARRAGQSKHSCASLTSSPPKPPARPRCLTPSEYTHRLATLPFLCTGTTLSFQPDRRRELSFYLCAAYAVSKPMDLPYRSKRCLQDIAPARVAGRLGGHVHSIECPSKMSRRKYGGSAAPPGMQPW